MLLTSKHILSHHNITCPIVLERSVAYMKKSKTITLPGAIFLFTGIIFFALSLAEMFTYYTIRTDYILTTATITDITSSYDQNYRVIMHVNVEYFANGKNYHRELNHYTLEMYIGQDIQIYYNPYNPNIIYFSGLSLDWIIFFIVGLVLFSIGLIPILYHRKKKRTYDILVENGQKIFATIVKVTPNTHFRVNGSNSYVILCKWIDPITGNTFLYKTPSLWFNPEPIIAERGITILPVYLDRANPQKYFVSTEQIERYLSL
jgi:hypothetical protein